MVQTLSSCQEVRHDATLEPDLGAVHQARVNLSIEYVTAEEARRAAERMTLEESLGRADRIREWHAEDRERAIRYLLGDSELEGRFADRPDYPRSIQSPGVAGGSSAIG